jgi:hypothetical protein
VIYLLSLFCLLALIAFVQLRFAYRRRELGKRSWQTILASVEPVDVEGLRRISDNFLKPDKEQLLLEPHEMWDIVGGLQGVARLRSNTTALLDLAVYAEAWSRMESRIIGEMIRRDAVRVRKAVWRIQLSFLLRRGVALTPFHLQEAASSYYLMRCRLLALYENTHAGLLPRLAEAV